jgi:hypothetical protein
MPRREAAIIAGLVGIVVAGMALWSIHRKPTWISDLDQVMVGARVILRGGNPYAFIGPGKQWEAIWPLYYPGPALLLALPISSLSIEVARAVFIGLGLSVFTWALLRRASHCWPMLLSYPVLASIDLVQWAPWLAAAMTLPWLGAVAAAKPNIGLAVIVGQRRRADAVVAIAGATLLTVCSLVVLPSWPWDWLAAIRGAPHIKSFVLRPFGFVLLLASLRWRVPEGRALLSLALVPMTAGVQEGLLLATLPRSRKEALVVALISHGMLPVSMSTSRLTTYQALSERLALGGLFFVFVPALALLLLRPNRPAD